MDSSDKIVEAIEEGKIVKVPEEYAKREGLLIIRKQEPVKVYASPKKKHEDAHSLMDLLKKKESWRESQVKSELIDNFSWKIKFERRKRGLTRNQLAHILNEPEESIKKLEYGLLPANDFVLINKIQSVLGLNLRKDGKDFTKAPKGLLGSQDSSGKTDKSQPSFSEGSEMDILDEELY